MKQIILAIRKFFFQHKRSRKQIPVLFRQTATPVIIREHKDTRFVTSSSVQVGNPIRIKGNKHN